MSIRKRKLGHIEVCMRKDVSYHTSSGLDGHAFIHNALPEVSLERIDTSTKFLGKPMRFPLIISGMTGGPRIAARVNRNIAIAAESRGVAMGVGSQRIMLEDREKASSFQVREYAQSIPLLANLGAIQLNRGYSVKECKETISSIGADALVLHLNPVQEAIQGGDTDWRGLEKRISKVVQGLGKPVIVKEVGFGISKDVGRRLDRMGVYAIDVSGSGGTSWAAVESHLGDEEQQRLGKTFWDWGIPTAEALVQNRGVKAHIIAGGGIRDGLDMAKAIALGADHCTMAGPFLKAAMHSPRRVEALIDRLERELRTAMFGIGVKNIRELKGTNALRKIVRSSI